jgi:multicomponent Na+:H+ antiporter subunit G
MIMMNIIVTILLLGGLLFFTGGAVGIIRFPDYYTRLHPAGKLDTMGLLMSMSAMAIYTLGDFSIDAVLTSIKIILIVIFVFITSPTATHAIVDAGVRAGLAPWFKEEEIEAGYGEPKKDHGIGTGSKKE